MREKSLRLTDLWWFHSEIDDRKKNENTHHINEMSCNDGIILLDCIHKKTAVLYKETPDDVGLRPMTWRAITVQYTDCICIYFMYLYTQSDLYATQLLRTICCKYILYSKSVVYTMCADFPHTSFMWSIYIYSI